MAPLMSSAGDRRGRRRAVPGAVVLAVVALVVVATSAVLVSVLLGIGDVEGFGEVEGSPGVDDGGPPAPTPTASPGPTPRGSPGAPLEPTDAGGLEEVGRPLSEVLVRAAGRFVSGDLGPREGPPIGALGEYGGAFSNGRDVVALRAWEWPSPAAAAGALDAPPAGFEGSDLRDSGAVGEPAVGEYRSYERDGRAALRWTNGALLLELTGAAEPVRELYLAYPV